ncbi:MAG: hypothetical protein K0M64_08520, partial [Rhizobium sp.]|nr:hypothetical protein [Rhizobium sp.]
MCLARVVPALVLGVLLSACGGEPAPGNATAPEAAASAAPNPAADTPPDDAGAEPPARQDDGFAEADALPTEGAADLDDIADLPFGQAIADAAGAAGDEE